MSGTEHLPTFLKILRPLSAGSSNSLSSGNIKDGAYASPKRRLILTIRHDVTFQKTRILNNTPVRNSNLISLSLINFDKKRKKRRIN
jgi:hypothetical protein